MSISLSAASPYVLGYEWLKNGAAVTDNANISGSSTDALVFATVALTNAGSYAVVVSNAYGAVTSSV